VGFGIGLERLVVLAERARDPTEQVVHRVLLAALALAALLDEQVGERLGLGPLFFVDVLGDERERGLLVVGIALQGELVRLNARVVLAEGFVA